VINVNDTTLGLISAAVPLLIIGFLILRRLPWIFAFFVALLAVGLGYLETTGAVREFGHNVRTVLPEGVVGPHGHGSHEAAPAASTPEEKPAEAPAMAPTSPPAEPATPAPEQPSSEPATPPAAAPETTTPPTQESAPAPSTTPAPESTPPAGGQTEPAPSQTPPATNP
jgi:outer membrane biosynthesis protein TonB